MTRQVRNARRFLVLLTSMILGVVLVVTGSPAIAAQPNPAPQGCEAQEAALSAVEQRIVAHNAVVDSFPNNEAPPAIANKINREAAALDSEAQIAVSNLDACQRDIQARAQALEQALERLTGGLPLSKIKATDSDLKRIANAPKPSPNWKPSATPPGREGYRIKPSSPARPIYNALRGPHNPGTSKRFGDLPLQGVPRPKIDDPDPAFPGQTIAANESKTGGPAVTADHIHPLAGIVQLDQFMLLNPENMYAVARAPLNLQWLSRRAHGPKLSRSMAYVDKDGLDPAWKESQVDLEKKVRAELQDIIRILVANQE